MGVVIPTGLQEQLVLREPVVPAKIDCGAAEMQEQQVHQYHALSETQPSECNNSVNTRLQEQSSDVLRGIRVLVTAENGAEKRAVATSHSVAELEG